MDRDELIRKAEIREVRKMVKEIRRNGDVAVSHYLSVAERTADDNRYGLLEDAIDFEAAGVRI